MNYVETLAQGLVTDEDETILNDFIARWHDDPAINIPLHEYLGVTEAQYSSLVIDPSSKLAVVSAAQTPDQKVISKLMAALRQYADPGFYHGMGFMVDPPGGGFEDDFDHQHGDEAYGAKPGKLARRTIAELLGQPYAEDEPEPIVEEPSEPEGKSLGDLLSHFAITALREEADVLEKLRLRLGYGALDGDEWNALLSAVSHMRLEATKRER